jgi:hypothetical protein
MARRLLDAAAYAAVKQGIVVAEPTNVLDRYSALRSAQHSRCSGAGGCGDCLKQSRDRMLETVSTNHVHHLLVLVDL